MPPRSRPPTRRAYQLHALLAYEVGFLLVVLGVTGSLAALRHIVGPWVDTWMPADWITHLGCEDGADVLRQAHVRLFAGRAGRVFVGMLGLFSTAFLLAGHRVAVAARPRRGRKRAESLHRRIGRTTAFLLVAFATSGFVLGLEPLWPVWALDADVYVVVERLHANGFTSEGPLRAVLASAYALAGLLPALLGLSTLPMLVRRARRRRGTTPPSTDVVVHEVESSAPTDPWQAD